MIEKKDPVAAMFEQMGQILREAGRVIREAMGIGVKFETTLMLRGIRLGAYIGTSILLGIFGGLWLDGELGTKPLFVIIGLVLGIAIAAFGSYWRLKPLIHKGSKHKVKKTEGEDS